MARAGLPVPVFVALIAGLGLLCSPPVFTQEDPGVEPPSPDEVRVLLDRVIANQHRDDSDAKCYERRERQFTRTSPNQNEDRILTDRTFRVVPTGTGTLKLLVQENGLAVNAGLYHTELLDWERVLEVAMHPDDPRAKSSLARTERREQQRNELVNGARDAFIANWAGREMAGRRVYDILLLEPNPGFQAHNMAQDVLTHVRAKIWIDHQSGQLARGEADIIRDISVAGFLGKVYRGGHFEIEQAEVAPGVWLPTRYQYDYMGRKFFFGFETHEVTEVGDYRRLGSTADVLNVVRNELQGGKGVPATR